MVHAFISSRLNHCMYSTVCSKQCCPGSHQDTEIATYHPSPTLCPTFSRLVVLGVFNIHVDAPKCPLAVDFLNLLDCLPLTQHVQGPTHKHGHTLDLAITADGSVTNTHVLELGISDHSVVLLDT